jgi:hypothetical protein
MDSKPPVCRYEEKEVGRATKKRSGRIRCIFGVPLSVVLVLLLPGQTRANTLQITQSQTLTLLSAPPGLPEGTLVNGPFIIAIDGVPVLSAGRMTGGGSVFTSSGVRVTHGFELHCDVAQAPNNLEVNWSNGNNFHLENLTSATCSDDPAIRPNPPPAGFDTYKGTGTGRYNGVAGATAEWTFTDAGEPGRNDTAKIVIKNASNTVVLTVSGKLKNGNQQAHAPPNLAPAVVTATETWALPLPGASYVTSCPTCGSDLTRCSGGFTPEAPQTITFVQFFELPAGFLNPSLSMVTTNDDAANVFLNGNFIGRAQTFGSLPGSVEGTFTLGTNDPSFFQVGTNEIRYELENLNAPCPLSMAYVATIMFD